MCFNPRTHVGCDDALAVLTAIPCVSIHAPTWGATIEHNIRYFAVAVSIHAPTWGATLLNSRLMLSELMFQSTHPRGVRLDLAKSTLNLNVSIHAPTWGATYWSRSHHSDILCFNPRTHVGCDALSFFGLCFKLSFNPRTHVGCDADYQYGAKMYLFQSTHPRGVRLIFSKYLNIILQKYINCEQHANF